MSHYTSAGFLTPPSSPPKGTQLSSLESDRRKLTGLASWTKRCNLDFRSLSLGPLTPPTSPQRNVPSPRRALTTERILQIDGNVEIDGHSPKSPLSQTKSVPATPRLDPSPATASHRTNRRIDRASPSNCSFAIPNTSQLGALTPLMRALPAQGRYPFPVHGRQPSVLSPLSLRRTRPQSLPGHRPQSDSSPRPRRFSGPDRYVPERSPGNALNENFRNTRPLDRLTLHERARRRRAPNSNPFTQRLRRQSVAHRPHIANTSAAAVATGANSTPLLPRRGYRANSARQISGGSIWNFGPTITAGDSTAAVPDGRGGLLGSGTNAPLYTAPFLTNSDAVRELDLHERRLALALDIDQSNRVLGLPEEPASSRFRSSPRIGSPHSCVSPSLRATAGDFSWQDSRWNQHSNFTVLDAPQLRDDFYCSLLAYSLPTKTLAVGLGNHVYLWSEMRGVNTPESLNVYSTSHITSIAFSSTQGGKAILAVGRADGRVILWSLLDNESRFDIKQQNPISCLAFRPGVTRRASKRDSHIIVDTEELLVGDEMGHTYYYSVEWPDADTKALFDWSGALTLLARISVHNQQVCGLAWSCDGEFFASGGNDNLCALFETKRVLRGPALSGTPSQEWYVNAAGERIWTVDPGAGSALIISSSHSKHQWILSAAVKAIAFCPWQRGLLAIGGGSNDRCIHFYHTISGACLATIDCSAQVTSLIWSTTRRELCATFGFAQPDHPYRIAVFAWPSCEQIVAIPWFDEHRALYAVSYSGGPNNGKKRGESGQCWQREAEEGCVVVATSDASIKFHEIWSEERRAAVGGSGLLGGSDILESLHGVDQRGNEAIR